MDKSDVVMEDVIKQPQDLENGGQQLGNNSVDGKHLVAEEDSSPTEVGADAQGKGKRTEMSDNANGNSDTEVSKDKESEAEDPSNATGAEGLKKNVTGEGIKEAEDLNNVTSEGVKEAEDPNNVTSEGVKEAEDQNNVTSEGIKEAEDPNNVNSGVKEAEDSSNEKNGVKEAEDPSNANNEGVKEADDADSVMSEEQNKTDGQHNLKSGAEQSKNGIESNGKDATENVEEDGNSHEKIVVDQKHSEDVVLEKNPSEQGQDPAELIPKKAPHNETGVADEAMADATKESENKTTSGDAEMSEAQDTKTEGDNTDQSVNEEMVNVAKDSENEIVPTSAVADGITESHAAPVIKRELAVSNHPEPVTPTALVKCLTAKAGSHSGETYKNISYESKVPGDEEGTPEEQATFMRELESFYRGRGMEFKPPRFYGQQLNCLKLWRSVIRLGGYDRVTGSKLWRQVGESFHPPKTCTTVSWTFRIFYEKALLEYERYKKESGELQLPIAVPDPSGVDGEQGNGLQASGSGRQRRDSAARAMQGWHAQRLFSPGEAGEPIVKDKNLNNMPKREKNLKSIGSLKQKRPNEVEHPVKAARTETSKQLVASVVDVGTPADWVKINVRETKDCFEVYALVPGLLREEVRVQSDPAGRLVITGTPEQPDNPWGITAFKKVVSLPARIDPLQTSAVVSLHGRLFVRVPFEQSNI